MSNKIDKEIINTGLNKARQAIESLLNTEILMINVDYEDILMGHLEDGDMLHLYESKLIGDLKGVCYLVFPEAEVKTILQSCLPPELMEDTEENKMVRIGMLMELDNIASASVITEFANHMKIDLYGDVPKLHIQKKEDGVQMIEEESKKYETAIKFKANFKGSKININPSFIWMFE